VIIVGCLTRLDNWVAVVTWWQVRDRATAPANAKALMLPEPVVAGAKQRRRGWDLGAAESLVRMHLPFGSLAWSGVHLEAWTGWIRFQHCTGILQALQR